MLTAALAPSASPAVVALAAPRHAVDGPGGAERPVAWSELAAERAYLVRFARRRLLDPALAEDLVHDVFMAVASGRARFGARSSLRSWLVAILKHKIVDLVRERANLDSLDAGSDDEGTLVHEPVCPQPGPQEVAEQRERLARTLERIGALPETLRRVLELRVFDDACSASVCRELDISEQNLFVRLHRARRALAA